MLRDVHRNLTWLLLCTHSLLSSFSIFNMFFIINNNVYSYSTFQIVDPVQTASEQIKTKLRRNALNSKLRSIK